MQKVNIHLLLFQEKSLNVLEITIYDTFKDSMDYKTEYSFKYDDYYKKGYSLGVNSWQSLINAISDIKNKYLVFCEEDSKFFLSIEDSNDEKNLLNISVFFNF